MTRTPPPQLTFDTAADDAPTQTLRTCMGILALVEEVLRQPHDAGHGADFVLTGWAAMGLAETLHPITQYLGHLALALDDSSRPGSKKEVRR